MQIVLSGKMDQFSAGRYSSPEWESWQMEPLRTRRIVPVYPLTQGLSSNKMRDMMHTGVSHWSARVPELLPHLSQQTAAVSLPQALIKSTFRTANKPCIGRGSVLSLMSSSCCS